MSKQLLVHRNLSSEVADYIKEKIFLGEYKAGERILESQIAEDLGISRAPVREAITELKNQGLIQSVPRKGNFIVEFSDEDFKEILDIRLLLENSIIEILIKKDKLNEEDFNYLNGIVDEMVEIAKQEGNKNEKIIRINEKDIKFHRYLWAKSGSNRRVKILNDLFLQLRLAMILNSRLTENLEESARYHYEIIKFLQAGGIKESQKILREHIEIFKDRA